MTDFIDYFIGHIHWLDEELALQIDEFVSSLSRVLSQYEADLADGQPSSGLGIAAAALVEAMVPDAKQALDSRFREILYPPPWWTRPLRLLARLQQWDSSKRRDKVDRWSRLFEGKGRRSAWSKSRTRTTPATLSG